MLRSQLPVVTKVTVASVSCVIMFCSQITSYVANNSSSQNLIGFYNVLMIKWICLKTLQTALVNSIKYQKISRSFLVARHKKIHAIYMSVDLTKGSFGHFSSFYVIKILKTSKISVFCMFLQESQVASHI